MNRGNYIRQVSTPLTAAGRREATDELSRIVSHSHEVLATATTVFPFTWFPDTVTVDREKLTRETDHHQADVLPGCRIHEYSDSGYFERHS
jgi:hypothetical protein